MNTGEETECSDGKSETPSGGGLEQVEQDIYFREGLVFKHLKTQTYYFDTIDQAEKILSGSDGPPMDCEEGPFQAIVDISPGFVRMYVDFVIGGIALCRGTVSTDMECTYLLREKKGEEEGPDGPEKEITERDSLEGIYQDTGDDDDEEEDHRGKVAGFTTKYQVAMHMMHSSIEAYLNLTGAYRGFQGSHRLLRLLDSRRRKAFLKPKKKTLSMRSLDRCSLLL